MLQKVLIRLGQSRLSQGATTPSGSMPTPYHVAAVRVNHDVAAELAIVQLDLDGVEPIAGPVVDLDQVSAKIGRRQATERYHHP